MFICEQFSETPFQLTPILSSGYSRFFRCIEEINKDDLPANSILFSVDVTRLYTNIPQDDGLEFCREALEGRTDKSIPTSFLIELLNILFDK